jgi:hypothetical protein
MELQATNNGIEKQHTTILIAKGRPHFVRTPLDFFKETLDHVIGPNRFPMLGWRKA